MSPKIIALILALATTLGGGSWFIYYQNAHFKKETKKLEDQKDTLQKELDALKKQAQENEEDEYAGWQTYTNSDIGYTLKYPVGWTLKETNQQSEVTSGIVKYIIIHTPDNLYFFDFGIKDVNGNYSTSERTGVGAGDWVNNGALTVLGSNITITKLVFEGRTKELFYPKNTAKTPDNKYEFRANFCYDTGVDFDNLDMTNLAYVSDVEKILASIELLSK